MRGPQFRSCDLHREMRGDRFPCIGTNSRIVGSGHRQVVREVCAVAFVRCERRPDRADNLGQCSQLVIRFHDDDQSARPVFEARKIDLHRQQLCECRWRRSAPIVRVEERHSHGYMSRNSVPRSPVVDCTPLSKKRFRIWCDEQQRHAFTLCRRRSGALNGADPASPPLGYWTVGEEARVRGSSEISPDADSPPTLLVWLWNTLNPRAM